MKILFSIALFFSLLPFLAYAEDESKIAAVVGGEVISTLDVQNRARMIINSATHPGALPSGITVEKVSPQALQMLIDEKLYNQEAARLNITLNNDELNHAVASIEEKNHLTPGAFDQFLAERNIPAETVKEQIRTQLIIAKIINIKIRPRITVGEQELNAEINRMTGNNNEISLKQLYIPITEEMDSSAQETEQARLEQLRAQMKGCDTFDKAASNANPPLTPSALTVNTASLNPAIRDVVAHLSIGELSPVLHTADSFQLLMVCGKKQQEIPQDIRSKLSEAISQRKIELQLKQYLRNLRQSIYVEVRMM